MKVQTSRNRAHMPFLIKKSKLTHQHSFYLSSCARSQKKKKKRKDISSAPPVRKLVIKTQQWHILYIVLSPLTLYWVLQGDQKHRKNSCTKNNANKAQVCMHHFHTTKPNQAVLSSCQTSAQIQNVNKTYLMAQPSWCRVKKILNKPDTTKEGMHSMRKVVS